MAGNPSPNRYSHTIRKVFDTAMDRMDIKRKRDRDDHRNDFALLTRRVLKLELELEEYMHLLDDLEYQVRITSNRGSTGSEGLG